MKAFRNLMVLTALLGLAACSNDENELPDGPVAAKVTANIGSVATRAVDDKWGATDQIGVMAASSTSTATVMPVMYKNVPYKNDGKGNFTATNGKSEGIFFQDATETVTFNAYYPYTPAQPAANDALPGTDGVISGSTQDQSTAEAQALIDYLFAQGATASRKNAKVAFSGENAFKHRMAQLIIQVKTSADDGFAAGDVKNAACKLGGLKHTGTFNVTTGAASADNEATAVTDWSLNQNTPNAFDATENVLQYSMILYPQTLTEALAFTATVGGQNYKNSTLIKPTLKAGYSYTYVITVKKTGLEVGNCTIERWSYNAPEDAEAVM